MGLLGGLFGGLGGILGGISRNAAIKKQQKLVNEQKKDNQNWYDRRYNEDATQRADAQAMLNQTSEIIKERNRQAAGSAAVMGGTEESVAATKAANAKALADATSAIVQAGEQRKDAIENRYLDTKQELNKQLVNLEGQKAGLGNIISAGIGGAAAGMGV